MKKLKNPIEILEALLEQVEARRAQDVDKKTQQNLEQANAAGGQAIPDYKGKHIYISFDGDNIGNAVARAEAKDNEQELANISEKIKSGQDLFLNFLMRHQGRLVEAGGDEGLGSCNSNCLIDLERFRKEYYQTVGATVTIGIGEKISQATKARMLGKLRGKNQVCFYDESTETELNLRTEQGGQEAKKLGQAGLLPEPPQPSPTKFASPSSELNQQANWQQDYDSPEEQSQQEEFSEKEEPKGQKIKEQKELKETEPEEEYYDYTDLPFDAQKDISHRKIAHEVSQEDGADPKFLYNAAKALLRR